MKNYDSLSFAKAIALGLLICITSIGDALAQGRHQRKHRPNRMMATSMVVPIARQSHGPQASYRDAPSLESRYDQPNASLDLAKEHRKSLKARAREERKLAREQRREFSRRQRHIIREDGSTSRMKMKPLKLRNSR